MYKKKVKSMNFFKIIYKNNLLILNNLLMNL